MTDIQFYHLTATPLDRALPKLLEKSYQGGFRTRVKLESEEKAEQMNAWLWTYDADSFLPHGTQKDGHGALQPIYLTAAEDNPGGADLLMITDGSTAAPEPELKRILDIFDGTDEAAVAAARSRWKQYQAQGMAVTYIRQTAGGGWEKAA